MKKIVLVASDIMPSQALQELNKELSQLSCEVVSFLGFGKGINNAPEIPKIIASANAVVTGMSTKPKFVEPELLAINTAIANGVPFGFYADTYGVYRRPWFENVRGKASFLFVINKEEAVGAKPLFPNAKIVATGNPMWEEFYFPLLSRKESRAELDIADNQTLIFCPGAKVLMMNAALFINTIEAANQLALMGKNPVVVISMHPGDPNPPETYADLIKYSRVPVKIITRDILTTSDIVPGADILVDFCSTTAIEAAHQRIPVINFFTEIQLGRLEEIIGTREWELNRLGVAEAVYGNAKDPPQTINRLLTRRDSRQCGSARKSFIPRRPSKARQSKKWPRQFYRPYSSSIQAKSNNPRETRSVSLF